MAQRPHLMRLSVVIIGLNESEHMQIMANSLQALRTNPQLWVETIFVDSASCDDSVLQAKKHFDTVIELKKSSHLCAAAGRFAGTNVAQGDWILYLDGDMVLTDAFARRIPNLLSEATPEVAGYIGPYQHKFDDGTDQLGKFSLDNSNTAHSIGGASLLRRSTVAAVNNWDPSVFAHEELELYARIINAGQRVAAISTPMIEHHTQKSTPLKNLLALFLPGYGLGKKYYGAGQLFASRLSKCHAGLDLAKVNPQLYLLVATLLAALILAGTGYPLPAAAILLIVITGCSAKNGWKLTIVYLSMVFRVPFGITKYRKHWQPTILSVWKKA